MADGKKSGSTADAAVLAAAIKAGQPVEFVVKAQGPYRAPNSSDIALIKKRAAQRLYGLNGSK